MKKQTLIGGGVVLFLLAVIVWLIMKNQTISSGYAKPQIAPPPRGEDTDTSVLSGSESQIPQTNDGNGNTSTVVVSVNDKIAKDALLEWTENIVDNASDVNLIRGKYDIGDNLFVGIPTDKEQMIIQLFREIYPNIDTTNYSNLPIYPVQGLIGQSQYADFSRIANYTQSDLSQRPLPSFVNLKIVGFAMDWSAPSGRLNDGNGKPQIGKNIFARDIGVNYTIQFFENMKNEVERFGRVVELEAIRVLIEGGWLFKEWNAQTIVQAIEDV